MTARIGVMLGLTSLFLVLVDRQWIIWVDEIVLSVSAYTGKAATVVAIAIAMAKLMSFILVGCVCAVGVHDPEQDSMNVLLTIYTYT